MSVPSIGEGYRGVEGHSGYLLRQAAYQLRGAMEAALRDRGLTPAQYAALSVLAREPGASGADLARACTTTAQAMTGVVAALERDGLVRRRAHPTHGRIRQVTLTVKGRRRLEQANPAVRRIEALIEDGLSDRQLAAVKAWLVTAAERLQRD